MKVHQKGHTTIIKDTQGDLDSFIVKITNEHHSFNNVNLIIDLTQYDSVSIDEILLFENISELHQKENKSFVIVVNNTDFTEVPDSLTVVPSELEAHDIIEMEEIERDLGF